MRAQSRTGLPRAGLQACLCLAAGCTAKARPKATCCNSCETTAMPGLPTRRAASTGRSASCRAHVRIPSLGELPVALKYLNDHPNPNLKMQSTCKFRRRRIRQASRAESAQPDSLRPAASACAFGWTGDFESRGRDIRRSYRGKAVGAERQELSGTSRSRQRSTRRDAQGSGTPLPLGNKRRRRHSDGSAFWASKSKKTALVPRARSEEDSKHSPQALAAACGT
jgi:hypothetical protein